MKRATIMATMLIAALLAFTACGKKVSVDKLKSQIQEAMLQEAKDEGSTLVINEFNLNDTGNGNYQGTASGVKDDTLNVVYNIAVTDTGDDFDAEWNLQ